MAQSGGTEMGDGAVTDQSRGSVEPNAGYV